MYPRGPLSIGDIAVQDLSTNVTLRGLDCFKLLCRNIPAYWPMLLFLYFKPFSRHVERVVCGCNDDSCKLPQEVTAAERSNDEDKRER